MLCRHLGDQPREPRAPPDGGGGHHARQQVFFLVLVVVAGGRVEIAHQLGGRLPRLGVAPVRLHVLDQLAQPVALQADARVARFQCFDRLREVGALGRKVAHASYLTGYCSSLMPASTMIFANFADSCRMKARNCSGVVGAGSKPTFLSLPVIAGSLSACTAAALSRFSTASGSPAGPKNPKKFTSSKPASGGCSAIAGTSGSADTRVVEVTPIGLIRPLSMKGFAAPMLTKVMVMCLPATSASCGAAPL